MTDIINFTKTTLKNIAPPEIGRDCYKDNKESGLVLYVTNSSTKSFYLYKKIKGRPERIFLGYFPDLSVEQARKAAAEAKGQIAKGKNPQEEKRSIRDEMTFKALFDEYMERHSKKTKKTSLQDEREVTKFVSHWFTKKISAITKNDMQKLHEKIGGENGLYAANRLLERIRGIFNKAIDWGWKGTNPALGIRKHKEKSRDRFLQPHELPYFFEALAKEENNTASDYVMISLLTGARKSNVLAMRWDQINIEQAQWRIPETKNGEPLLLPISTPVIEILRKRRKLSPSAWVFPSPASKLGYLQDPKKAWKRILIRAEIYQHITILSEKGEWDSMKIAEEKESCELSLAKSLALYRKNAEELELDSSMIAMQDLRIHDLRRSLGSWQAVTGANSFIIGKSLGHKSTQATAIYARLNLDPVRASVELATAAMMQAGGLAKETQND